MGLKLATCQFVRNPCKSNTIPLDPQN